jgi:hypothetical protein
LRSSSRISLTEAVPDENKLSSNWGGVFFHPLFVENGVKCLGLEGRTTTIEYEGRELGASNIVFQKRTGIRAATIPLLFQYFGPVFYDSGMEENFFDGVIDIYGTKCDYIYLSFPPEFQSIDKLAGGWIINKAVTLALDGSQLDEWGNNFRDDVRNKINKANRNKVRIERTNSLNERLWESSFSRKGLSPPIKPLELKRWCSALLENSLLRIYAAIIDDSAVAFRGQLIYGGFAYDWIAGSDPDYHQLGTNQLLMAEIGSDLRKEGVSIWDLVDARVAGIAEFKKSFGAVEYYHWQASKAFGIKGKLFEALRRIKNA